MSTERLSIDVIIPVFNGRDYIEAAVLSVLNQTYPPVNLIVVNDGSSDNTQGIIERIKEENTSSVKIQIVRQENKGLSAARNTGIRSSVSEYLAFLDADDIWFPDKLKLQAEVFQNTELKNAGLVYCNYCIIDTEGKLMTDAKVLRVNKAIRGYVFDKITAGNFISGSGSAVLVKRSCFEVAGIFDENLKAYEDWDMWLRLAQNCDFDFTDEVLVRIRQHGASMQKDKAHMNKNALLFYSKWLPYVNDPGTLKNWAYRIAKPVYINGYRSEYLDIIKSVFTKEDLNKLFARTFGSIELYVFLKRISGSKYRLKE